MEYGFSPHGEVGFVTLLEFEQIGAFSVHKSIISGLTGWEPNYWSVLELETRKRIKRETIESFRSTLEAYSDSNIDNCHPDYIYHLILRAARISIGSFWRDCIYEHNKRLNEIQESRAVQCGAKTKAVRQCRAKAIHGSWAVPPPWR